MSEMSEALVCVSGAGGGPCDACADTIARQRLGLQRPSPLPTEATHGMAEQDSVATYRMGQLADALREAGFLVGDGEYDLIIRYATKCIQESGKWVVARHAT